jgi:hypothetical protein
MNNLIYINNVSISKELCEDIIDIFEKEPNKYEGVTQGGLDKNIKDTKDFSLNSYLEHNSEDWNKIRIFLKKELVNNLKEYYNANKFYTANDYRIFGKKGYLNEHTFLFQRYTARIGKFSYHNDFSIDYEKKQYRILTYIWYLNDVQEGGETEINGSIKIKPEAGKLLLFPASWLYPHCGCVPISNDKYIITGWLYDKF